MRWTFYIPGELAQEDEQRQSISHRIDQWWEAFRDKAADLDRLFHNQADWDLTDWMEQHLQSIDPRLMWEFGASANGHQLVITPETQYHLRPLVDEILSRAPALADWTFLQYRTPENVDQMKDTLRSRTGADPAFTGIALALGELNRVDLAFQFPRSFLESSTAIAHTQAFVAAECLLGEDMLSDWLGKLDAFDEVAQPLAAGAVPRAFTSLVAKQRSSLPTQPFMDRLSALSWTDIELKPQEAADYAHRFDLTAGITGALELWRNAHSDQRFWSGRFSRCGETFCYIKIDRTSHSQGASVEERFKLETELNTALMERRLGCGIGGGIGLRYTYVDLAVIDVRAAAGVIRDVLQRTPFGTSQAWLQFFDTTLGTEWIGLHPHSIEPPMALA